MTPHTAEVMKQTGNFNVDDYKTWFNDPGDNHKKTAVMRGHFEEVAAGDAILVLNYEKHGQANYIGGNVLMERRLLFSLVSPCRTERYPSEFTLPRRNYWP